MLETSPNPTEPYMSPEVRKHRRLKAYAAYMRKNFTTVVHGEHVLPYDVEIAVQDKDGNATYDDDGDIITRTETRTRFVNRATFRGSEHARKMRKAERRVEHILRTSRVNLDELAGVLESSPRSALIN